MIRLLPGGGPSQTLRLLVRLRWLAVAGVCAALLLTHRFLDTPLPMPAVVVPLAMLCAWNFFQQHRLRKALEASDNTLTLNLAVDVAILTWVLWLTGGATNPCVSLYLVPIALGSAMLPAPHAWGVAALSAGGYTMLLLSVDHAAMHGGGGAFALHVTGMWLNFLVAAVLVVVFVGALGQAVRRRERLLADYRERQGRDEEAIRVGALAANAVHEINTPLATASLLTDGLLADAASDSAEDLGLLRQQVQRIRSQLDAFLDQVQQPRSAASSRTTAQAFIQSTAQAWRSRYPEVSLEVEVEASLQDALIVGEESVRQAINTVLSNAAMASRLQSSNRVNLGMVRADGDMLEILVEDEGAGDPEAIRRYAERPGIDAGDASATIEATGMGIGLFLARTELRRLGGGIDWRKRSPNGVTAAIQVPLAALEV